MVYRDNVEIRVGDVVSLGSSGKGVVVACIDRNEYSPDHSREQWGYLGVGVVIDTDFGGLVHYPDQEGLDSEPIALLSRKSA